MVLFFVVLFPPPPFHHQVASSCKSTGRNCVLSGGGGTGECQRWNKDSACWYGKCYAPATCNNGDSSGTGFVISGARNSDPDTPKGTDLNGEYTKTTYICHGKAVWQKGGSTGPVLFMDGNSDWDVGPSGRAKDCDGGYVGSTTVYMYSQAQGNCPISPDRASCAKSWQEHDSHNHARANSALRVVASSGQCVDLPFQSKDGKTTCLGYEQRHLCTPDGGYGSGWDRKHYGTFRRWAINGVDATQACCACGGGKGGHKVRRRRAMSPELLRSSR